MKNELKKIKTEQSNGKTVKIFVISFVTIIVVTIIFLAYMITPGIFTLDLFKSSTITTEDIGESFAGDWTPKDVEKEIAAGTLPQDVEYGY